MMRKREAIQKIKEAVGFVPHQMILDLYDDFEDIPDQLVDLQCEYFKPPKPMMILTGKRLYEKIKELL